MPELVLVEPEGPVVTLRLNAPERRNAMGRDMALDLTEKLHRAGATARALIIAGHSTAFCAGNNLASAEPLEAGAVFDAGLPLESHFNPLMQAIKESPVPVVAAVRGAAAGIGASIALACDLIVAGESAYFLQAFRRIGLVPDGGAALLLAHAAGRVRAMEMMLLGERVPASQALAWGMINRVMPDSEVESTAQSLAANLAAGPTTALGLIRRAAWSALYTRWEAQLALEREFQREAGLTHDFNEGIAAFFEKREPRFTGK